VIGVSAAGPRPEDADRSAAASNGAPWREPQGRRSGEGSPTWDTLDLARLDAASEREYWVALSLVPGLGPAAFARLLHRFGSGRAAWDAGAALLDEVQRPPPEAASVLGRLRRSGPAALLRRVEAALRPLDGRILTALDAEYPPLLHGASPRPAVLYHAGDTVAYRGPAVAVVGTRRATGYGRSSATRIADELARAGVTVVSGLALGIDGEAHVAAVEAGGRSVAVLPSPLDRIYPPRHRHLAKRLGASGGAVVSELAPGHVPGRPDFARRNRIIAGLALATVVVEAPDRSGALLTAAAAVELGREVHAVPGPIDAVTSRGCNRLIADHVAALVTSPVGLLTSLGLASGLEPPAVASLSDPEAMVLARLLKRPASVEELLAPTDLGTGALAGVLTMLEARGLVTSYGGATFHPTLVARRIGRASTGGDGAP
jgi:DNA processing protein